MNCGLAEDVTYILWKSVTRLSNNKRQRDKHAKMQLEHLYCTLIPFAVNLVKVEERVYLDFRAEKAVLQSHSFYILSPSGKCSA